MSGFSTSTEFLSRLLAQTETNWMDELDSKLRNLEELEAARAKEAWEKHVVSTQRHLADEKYLKLNPVQTSYALRASRCAS